MLTLAEMKAREKEPTVERIMTLLKKRLSFIGKNNDAICYRTGEWRGRLNEVRIILNAIKRKQF